MKIYCDLDDVLVDFSEQANRKIPGFCGWDTPRIVMSEFLHNCRVSFWAEMAWMSNGLTLWSFIRQFDTYLLSALPRKSEMFEGESQVTKNTTLGKQLWVARNLGLAYSQRTFVVPRKEKQSFVESKSSILIDDAQKNIDEWEIAGGTGILHKNDRVLDTLEALNCIIGDLVKNANSPCKITED